ncbi:MAG TPA: tetratricopeptide repeat protein [Candidatus Methylacidiphilales bacterium]|nr:tetratricopeptide repeat protein [Candidatus Methylacidiphilales bacterium]
MGNELSSEEKAGRALRLLQAVILVLAGWWTFAPALTGGWIWDDLAYLPKNPLLHDPAWLWKTWFIPGTYNEYYPLTETAQGAQWMLWRQCTLFYHVANVMLHLVSALLIWRLLEKLGLRLGWLGGLIFAIHPLTVESVAWISELKNTLSLALFLAAIIFYLAYDEQGRERDYRLALGFFLAAMLAKATMAAFPLAILLYAWWKRGQIGQNDLRAAAPFFAVSVVLVALTVLASVRHAQTHPEMGEQAPGEGVLGGLVNAGVAIFFFASKFFWPFNLMLIYPRWLQAPAALPDLFPWMPVVVTLGVLWWKRRQEWSRHLLLGLGFYLLMLAPVLVFIVTDNVNMIWSLDHLAYLPMIGLIGLVVAGVEAVSAWLSPRLRCAGMGVLGVALAVLAGASHARAALFQDEETLWKSTLQSNSGSWAAHDALGDVLEARGRFPEAMAEYAQALHLYPNSAGTHASVAFILLQTGHVREALAAYAQSLKINPYDAYVHYNFGNALSQTGNVQEAIAQYEAALKIDPSLEEAHYNLGNSLIQTGHIPEAAAQYETALLLNPDYGDAHTNLGNALLQMGRVENALNEYGEALRINPNDPDVHANVGMALLVLGRVPAARAQFETALKIDPHNATAQNGLARINAPGGAATGK